MEPSDFDKILREKLHENHDLHTQEMESAKPFVWSAVYNEIGRKKTLTWYHLAAAVVLLMITFSVLLVNVQKGHQNEISQLSNKIDQLEKSFVTQAEQLQVKDTQLTSMKNELKNVEMRFASMDQQTPVSPKETVVYRTDTVIVKQVEYVTVVEKPAETETLTASSDMYDNQNVAIVQLNENTTDDEIFPSSRLNDKQKKSEAVRLTFSPFTSRSN
jgi:septal ring factor EnvC (AmiA/AmiB activator)